jgi:hypothetical protein
MAIKYRPTIRTWVWSVIGIFVWATFVLALDKIARVTVPPTWIVIGTICILCLSVATGFKRRCAV